MGHNHYPATAWELEAARRREVVEADVVAARAAASTHRAQGIGANGIVARIMGSISIASRRSAPDVGTIASARDDGMEPCQHATGLKQAG